VNLRFPSEQGLITVREESRLTHAGGAATRARCTAGSGREFDVHRLRLAPKGGAGFVTLADLEALTLEVEMMREAGEHPNVQRCFASLVENEGGVHCRVLLCDPCTGSLRCALAAQGGVALPLNSAVDVGKQLALGLGHLHSVSILYGGLRPEGILRGQDGCWKLADFSRSVRMPLTLGDWRELNPTVFAKGAGQSLPPELSDAPEETGIDAVVDVWFLGLLLANLILGKLPGGGTRELGEELLVSASALERSDFAIFWTLLHMPLAAEPTDRPSANEISSVLGAATQMFPTELLEDMPPRVRNRCLRAATMTARQLAVELLVEQAAPDILERAASQSLRELVALLPDAIRVETLCANFGFSPSALPRLTNETEAQKPDLSPAAAHDEAPAKGSQTTSADGCSTDDCGTSSGEADSQSSGSNSRSTSPSARFPRPLCESSEENMHSRKQQPHDLIDLGMLDVIDL